MERNWLVVLVAGVEGVHFSVWPLMEGKETSRFRAPPDTWKACIAPDGRRVVAIKLDGSFSLHHVEDGQEILQVTSCRSCVDDENHIHFNSDGTLLIFHQICNQVNEFTIVRALDGEVLAHTRR